MCGACAPPSGRWAALPASHEGVSDTDTVEGAGDHVQKLLRLLIRLTVDCGPTRGRKLEHLRSSQQNESTRAPLTLVASPRQEEAWARAPESAR